MTLKGLKKNRINFVSFTPGTSFELRSKPGHLAGAGPHLLAPAGGLGPRGTGPLNVFQGLAGRDKFRETVKRVPRSTRHRRRLERRFRRALLRHVVAAREAGKPDIRARFEELADRFRYYRDEYPAGGSERQSRAGRGRFAALLARVVR